MNPTLCSRVVSLRSNPALPTFRLSPHGHVGKWRFFPVLLIALALGVAGVASPARAALVERTFGGGSNGALPSGTHTWEVDGNWTGDVYPNTGGPTGANAIIGNASGNRVLSTGGGPYRLAI